MLDREHTVGIIQTGSDRMACRIPWRLPVSVPWARSWFTFQVDRRLGSLAGHALQRLERRKGRLGAFLRQLRLPKPTTLTVNGHVFQLPLRSADYSEGQLKPTAEELSYLAGFFDGDGCVSVQTQLSSCVLRIEQSYPHAAVLLKFQRALGGTVSAATGACGCKKPKLAWQITGSGCRDAAGVLAAIPSMKREQLSIAANWPRCNDTRASLAQRMRQLKCLAPSRIKIPDWEYFAGFFDAEGCIRLYPSHGRVSLSIGQKHEPILLSFKAFVHQELQMGETCHIYYHHTSGYELRVNRMGAIKAILIKLLAGGLHQKQQAAVLVLKNAKEHHEQSRLDIAQLLGNQGRYARLDADGCERSREIQRMRGRLRYRARSGTDVVLVQQLQSECDRLVQRHAELSMVTSVALLRRDIRTLLKQGATLVPRRIVT